MTLLRALDDTTLQISERLPMLAEWGDATLTRLFNFRSRQVTTIYERGGLKEYRLPRGDSYGSDSKGYAAAVTSSMEVRNFRDFECRDEIIDMHAELVKSGGHPPPLEEIFPDTLAKPGLKPAAQLLPNR